MATVASETTQGKKQGFNFTDEHRAKALQTRRERAQRKRELRQAARMRLDEAYAQEVEQSSVGIARAMVSKALEGDVSAARELADRIYGKAVARVEVAHEHPIAQLEPAEAAELLDALRAVKARRAELAAATIEGEVVSQSPLDGDTPH